MKSADQEPRLNQWRRLRYSEVDSHFRAWRACICWGRCQRLTFLDTNQFFSHKVSGHGPFDWLAYSFSPCFTSRTASFALMRSCNLFSRACKLRNYPLLRHSAIPSYGQAILVLATSTRCSLMTDNPTYESIVEFGMQPSKHPASSDAQPLSSGPWHIPLHGGRVDIDG